MHKPPNELFASLHQLAATVTTVFEVLADTKAEDRGGNAPSAPPPQPASSRPEPTAQAPAPPLRDMCLACGRVCEAMAARVKHGRICGACIDGSLADIRQQLERAVLEQIAGCIDDQLAALRRYAHDAIDLDGARTLPILDSEVSQLCDAFRSRRGPFEEASKPASDRFDDADLDLSASRPEAMQA